MTPCSTPGSSVLCCLLEFSQIHAHWVGDAISSSAARFSSCPQSFPESGSFTMSWLFSSGGQSIGASASASALPMTTQGWFPLGLTGLISLLSKGLSRVFSNTTVPKHQFFSAQPSLPPGSPKFPYPSGISKRRAVLCSSIPAHCLSSTGECHTEPPGQGSHLCGSLLNPQHLAWWPAHFRL